MSPNKKTTTPLRKQATVIKAADCRIKKATRAPRIPAELFSYFNQGVIAQWGAAHVDKSTMTDEALRDVLVEHAKDKGIKAALASLVATGRSTKGRPGYTITRGDQPAVRYEYSAASDKETRKTFDNPRQKRDDGEELEPAERAQLEEMFCKLDPCRKRS